MFRKGLIGYLPANILQGLIGFATLMVFTRILSPEDYGRYALAFGASSLAQTVCFTWLEAAMARFYPAEARDDVTAPALYGSVYRLFAGVTIVFAVICGIGMWLWPAGNDLTDDPALKIAVAYGLGAVVFRSLIKLVQEQRRSEGRVGAASILDMLQTAGGFGLGVAFALLGTGGGSPLLGAAVIALICLPFFAREDWGRAVRGRFDAERAKAYAHYGFPIAASLVLTLALYTADRFLIAHYLSEADAGAYHAGYSLASRILDVLFIWFGAAGTPAMVHALESGGEKALKTTAAEQIKTMSFILFPAVGGLIMVAPAFGELMIGEDLRAKAVSITTLVALGALFSGLNTYYFLQAFTLAKKTRLLVVAMLIPAVANIALNVILIPRMGLIGAAWACALSFGAGLIGSWLLGLRTLPLPVPAAVLVKTALCTAVMMAAISVLPSHGGIIELVLKSATGGIIYGFCAYFCDLHGIRAHLLRFYNLFRAKLGV
jgi:O-antigen/teichoic acid export membrane protein